MLQAHFNAIGSTMNVGAMSVSRSVHTVSAILAVNSNRDIYFPRNPGAVISTSEGFLFTIWPAFLRCSVPLMDH